MDSRKQTHVRGLGSVHALMYPAVHAFRVYIHFPPRVRFFSVSVFRETVLTGRIIRVCKCLSVWGRAIMPNRSMVHITDILRNISWSTQTTADKADGRRCAPKIRKRTHAVPADQLLSVGIEGRQWCPKTTGHRHLAVHSVFAKWFRQCVCTCGLQ